VRCLISILAALLLALGAGCRTSHPLPSADFIAPGWSVYHGQAIWKSSQNQTELAGDLLLATNVNGNVFIQFSKIPFPLVTAQVSGNEWQIEFGADKYSWHGRGAAPERFVWFQLPPALRNANIGGHWQFARVATNSWCLKNPNTGETLEGVFFP
jgi:hypothetical protein